MTKLGTDLATHLPTELGTDVAGPSGPPPPTVPVLYGLQSFTTLDYYQTGNPGGIEGAASGFWVAALGRIDSIAVASTTRTLLARYNSTVLSGWAFLTAGTNTSLNFYNIDGASAARPSPTYTVTAGDVGKILHVVGVREAGVLRLFVNKLQVGAGAAITGYTPAADRMYVGRRTAGNPSSSATFFGACGGLGIPTLAEIQTQADAIKLAGDIVEIPGKTDSLWSPKQDQLGSAPSVLEDKVGAEDMQRAGAPVLVQVTNPVWGW